MEAILSTKRLLLRPFEPGDAEACLCWLSDHRVMDAVHQPVISSLNEAEQFVAARLPYYSLRHFCDWAIVLRDTGRAIGECNASVSLKESCADVGYAICYDCWNQGYMTEALKAVLPFLNEQGFLHIVAACHPSALASAAVLKKAGMKQMNEVPSLIRKMEEEPDLTFYEYSGDPGIRKEL
ncbi:MAG: GNAT family N-acetyltransferase [Bulleidia sp.]